MMVPKDNSRRPQKTLAEHAKGIAALPGGIAPAREAAAREALKDNKISASMLSVLRRARDMHRRIKAPGYACAQMEIDVGLLPRCGCAIAPRMRRADALTNTGAGFPFAGGRRGC